MRAPALSVSYTYVYDFVRDILAVYAKLLQGPHLNVLVPTTRFSIAFFWLLQLA